MQRTPSPTLASRAHVEAEDLDWTARVERERRALTARPEVRHALPQDGANRRDPLLRCAQMLGLYRAGCEIVRAYNARATEPELLAYANTLVDLVHDLFVGAARHPLPDLKAMEAEHDHTEDLREGGHFAASLAGEATTPEDKREWAAALRRQAASSVAFARGLEAAAREQERQTPPVRPAA